MVKNRAERRCENIDDEEQIVKAAVGLGFEAVPNEVVTFSAARLLVGGTDREVVYVSGDASRNVLRNVSTFQDFVNALENGACRVSVLALSIAQLFEGAHAIAVGRSRVRVRLLSHPFDTWVVRARRS